MGSVKPHVAAITWRNQTAVLALLLHDLFLIRRFSVAPSRVKCPVSHVAATAAELCADYDVQHVVVEPRDELIRALGAYALEPLVVSLDEAKARLVPEAPRAPHRLLYERLLERHPRLRRFVRTFKGSGFAASHAERRRTVALLAVALALTGREQISTNQPL